MLTLRLKIVLSLIILLLITIVVLQINNIILPRRMLESFQSASENENQKVILVHENPDIYLIKNFLTEEECDYIIKVGEPHIKKSEVCGKNGSRPDKSRTSMTAHIGKKFLSGENKDEKFSSKSKLPLKPPRLLKVQKDGTNGLVEWYNTDARIKSFVVLYVDVKKMKEGVWVENNITCQTKKCRIVIKNLLGNRYKLAVLSQLNGEVSPINENDIVTFADDVPYDGLATEQGMTLEAEGDNEEIRFPENETLSPKESASNPSVSHKNNKNNTSGESSAPTPSPAPGEKPQLDCANMYVKLKNIKTMEELESVEVTPKCEELEDMSAHLKPPFYHYLWDKIF